MARTSSIYDHFDPCDLDLQPTWKNVSNSTSPPWGQQLCKIVLKSMHKNVQVMARTSSIYDHFDLYLTPMTLTFNLPENMFQMALLLLEDNNCAKLFLKSMLKCTSYGPHKLNIWPFWPLFDLCDLDLQPTWKNVSNGTSPPGGQQLWCPWQAQFITILSFDLQVWLWPATYANKCFERHFSFLKTTVQNYFEIHALLYKLWSRQIRMDARTQAHTTN